MVKRVTIVIDDDDFDWVERKRGLVKRSNFFTELVRKAREEDKKK